MQTSSDSIANALRATPAPQRSAATVRPDAPRGTSLLWQALMLGISGDALLRAGIEGPAFVAWIAILALAILSLTWQAGGRVPREALGWMPTAILSSGLTALRDADGIQALDVLAAAGSLGLAAIALRDWRLALWAPRLRDTLWAAASIVGNTAKGIVP